MNESRGLFMYDGTVRFTDDIERGYTVVAKDEEDATKQLEDKGLADRRVCCEVIRLVRR